MENGSRRSVLNFSSLRKPSWEEVKSIKQTCAVCGAVFPVVDYRKHVEICSAKIQEGRQILLCLSFNSMRERVRSPNHA